jgi:ribosomal protein S18 acetylase RimI-like enzyme
VTTVSCSGLIFRRPIPDDWERVTAVMPSWWDGRDLRALLPRVFFEHFRGTSLLVEHEHTLVAFLVGFLCADHADEAYVHFVGVAPEWRRVGLASDLYRRFFALATANGRSVVRSVTAPVNNASIAFHTALGFSVLPSEAGPGDAQAILDGSASQAGPYVRFQLHLAPDPASLGADT